MVWSDRVLKWHLIVTNETQCEEYVNEHNVDLYMKKLPYLCFVS